MDEPNYAFNTHPINTKIDVTKKLKLIVFPFTTWPTKHWPAEHWQTFLKLAENYFTVVIAWGSKEEYQQAQSFCKDLKGCELAPTLSIESMKGFLSHCDAFVGVDTGFSHLATALMIPGIVLMGPTDKKKSGPLGCQQIALDVDLPCRACHKRICPLPQDQTMNPKRLGTTKTLGTKYLAPKCLVLISPEFVLQQLQRLIKT
jgi:heptosyltransferase-1